MSRIPNSPGIEIAALKKKQRTVFDPMVAGSGTPWEDRGTHGTIGAFFKTCSASMSAPGALMASIRRPETKTDAKGFLIGISIVWGLSALIHMGLKLWLASRQPNVTDVDPTLCAVYCVLAIALGAGGTFIFYSTYVKMYGKLVAQEKDAVLMPEVLIYNINVYAFGPSLLALIPVAGPPIAIIWILANLVVAGNSRLKIRFPAAMIDALLSFLAMLAIIGGIWLAGWLILQYFGSIYAVTIKIPKVTLQKP
jgi:hypothetical protein